MDLQADVTSSQVAWELTLRTFCKTIQTCDFLCLLSNIFISFEVKRELADNEKHFANPINESCEMVNNKLAEIHVKPIIYH